jgi:hypothetical protein
MSMSKIEPHEEALAKQLIDEELWPSRVVRSICSRLAISWL